MCPDVALALSIFSVAIFWAVRSFVAKGKMERISRCPADIDDFELNNFLDKSGDVAVRAMGINVVLLPYLLFSLSTAPTFCP